MALASKKSLGHALEPRTIFQAAEVDSERAHAPDRGVCKAGAVSDGDGQTLGLAAQGRSSVPFHDDLGSAWVESQRLQRTTCRESTGAVFQPAARGLQG